MIRLLKYSNVNENDILDNFKIWIRNRKVNVEKDIFISGPDCGQSDEPTFAFQKKFHIIKRSTENRNVKTNLYLFSKKIVKISVFCIFSRENNN